MLEMQKHSDGEVRQGIGLSNRRDFQYVTRAVWGVDPKILIPLTCEAFGTALYSISLADQRFDAGQARGRGAAQELR